MNEIRIPQSIWERATSHLFQDNGEHIVFFLGEVTQNSGIRFLVRDAILIKNEEMECDGFAAQVQLKALLEVVNSANKTNLALIEMHNHGFSYHEVDFSRTDYNGFKEFVPYIFDVLPGRPYAAIVVTPQEQVNALVWRKPDNFEPISSVSIVGSFFRKYVPTVVKGNSSEYPVSHIHSRQVNALGKDGQKIIQSVRVAVVGCGGIGSHVVQQLAYLGIRNFNLIDADRVEDTNLNRLIGASESDIGKPKVDVLEQMVSIITNGEADVRTVQNDLRSPEAFETLKRVDVIFGCVDNDGARLILNQLSLSYLIHYIDCATGINLENEKLETAGGQVMIVQPEGPCLECAKMIDIKEASDILAPKEEYEIRKKLGYVKGNDIPDPSVVSLNGIIASIAVTEFIMLVTCLRPVKTITMYDMLEGREPSIVPRTLKKDEKCLHNSLVGIGDKIHLERYLKRELIR